MMTWKLAGNSNDEYYTPAYAIRPILKYLVPYKAIWCPFDTTSSFFVKLLEEQGHVVTATHISMGGDFFQTPPPSPCDAIVSNPPWSKKIEVLERLFDIGIPFAMLVGAAGLFESRKKFDLFRAHEFEIMRFDKRVCYFKDWKEIKPGKAPPFNSVYVCSGILPRPVVFEKITREM